MMWHKIYNNYEASDSGLIRNSKTHRILKQFKGKDGYYRAQFNGKTRLIHREIAKAFLDKIDGKDYVNHKDGDKSNNSVNNLEWCTSSENQVHAYTNHLKTMKGTNNSRAKLTEDDVKFIKSHYIPRDNIYGGKALAKKYNVSRQTICAVAHEQNWKGF